MPEEKSSVANACVTVTAETMKKEKEARASS
jgi:hypothetical protein